MGAGYGDGGVSDWANGMKRTVERLEARNKSLEAEVDRLRNLSSCNLCLKGLCSAHQPLIGQRDALQAHIDRALDSLNRYAANGLDIPNENIPALIATLEGTG